MQNPLAKLLVDEVEIAEDALATVLAPLIGLTHNGEIVFKPGVERRSNRVRLLSALLGVMAASRLQLRKTDLLTPKELEALTGIRGGTLRPLLRSLAGERLIEGRDGCYRVPAYAFNAALDTVRNG